jgi:hypothetical protein
LCERITQPGLSLKHQKECIPKDNTFSSYISLELGTQIAIQNRGENSNWNRGFPLFEQWDTIRSCLLLKGTYTCFAFIGKGVSGVKGTLVFALAV